MTWYPQGAPGGGRYLIVTFAPTSVRMASNSVCSSTGAAAAASAGTAGAGPAAAATGAALTPHFSCRVLLNWTSSSTLSCSISAMMVSTDMGSIPPLNLFLLRGSAAQLFGVCLNDITQVTQWCGK